ncbi:MAG: hypothetical protein EHM42_01365 [Planctomycetaceae bacterium]|nr:MAG: hypothetical protein EHM42_01365 [Planctomycetaceae bacterium]
MSTATNPAATPVDRPPHPQYMRVLLTFFRNSLVREMQFRGNFLIEVLTHAFWFAMQLVFFRLIFGNVSEVNGWSKEEYFGFMATGMILNALMEAFFVPNLANLSELVRTGGLDFALLKPIDTQFLVSFEKLDLGALCHLLLPFALLGFSVSRLGRVLTPVDVLLYVALILLAVAFFYSLMLVFASTSVWLGRNQGLYEFWFYITIFARYPRDIYRGSLAADALRMGFTFIIPILLVVTVPAEVLVGKAFHPFWLLVMSVAAVVALFVSRRVFHLALRSYRSASS